jgi:serine/threonine-protein kinase HipA
MRKALVYQQGVNAGLLEELEEGHWKVSYHAEYCGTPVSLTMPLSQRSHEFDRFPPVFEGLLAEGIQLEALLRRHKLDRQDMFAQLMLAGSDLVGSLTLEEVRGEGMEMAP